MSVPTSPRRALVTGASAGIGRAFATALAADGYTVTAVARGADGLAGLRAELGDGHEYVAADLSTGAGLETVTGLLTTPHTLLVNNAGTAVHGDFGSLPVTDELGVLDLNCRAVVALSHAFLARASAGDALINVASTLAFTPKPGMAMYGASKAFVTAFTESLWHEQLSRGVRVFTLCPGITRTRSQTADGVPSWLVQTPEQVVERALAARLAGRGPLVYTNRRNRLFTGALRALPTRRRLALLSD